MGVINLGKIIPDLSGFLSNKGGTISGNLTVTGEIISNNNITAYSDEKVKRDFKPLGADVIERLKKVKFYNFKMINDPLQRTKVGVKAQELEKLFPELVSQDENGIKMVDYIGLNVYFNFAMQEALKKL